MWFFVIFLGIFVFDTSSSYEIEVVCPEEGYHKYAQPLTQCQSYYTCTNGRKETKHCPPGTIYSSQAKKCKASGNCYELVCAGRIDGRYSDPTEQCSRTYTCTSGSLTLVQPRFKDDTFLEVCPNLDESAAHIFHKLDICESRENGLHQLNDCSMYVECNNRREIEVHFCPAGTNFNGSSCVSDGKCVNICSKKEDGYYADDTTHCRNYVYCQRQNIFSKHRCPGGTVFNGHSCVHNSEYECPIYKKCEKTSDGLYSDYSKSCRSYYQCANRRLVYEGSCGIRVWNGTQCVSQNEFPCHGPHSSIDCLGKKGFYADKISKCNKYFYCNYGKKTTFNCKHGQVFNGFSCVPENQYHCPTIQANSCEGKSSGYYTDLETGCKTYYYCAESNKIFYICPEDRIFNGQECVHESQYTCPVSHIECNNRPDGYHISGKFRQEIYYCRNSLKIISMKCRDNNLFEGSKCSYLTKPENICSQIKHGYITDTNCKVYHKCNNYNLIESGICGDGYVFNGKACAHHNNHQCVPNYSCKGKANSFYQDFLSQCRKYYYCNNNHKTELICAQGQVHNGNVCVNQSSYRCPSYSKNIVYLT